MSTRRGIRFSSAINANSGFLVAQNANSRSVGMTTFSVSPSFDSSFGPTRVDSLKRGALSVPAGCAYEGTRYFAMQFVQPRQRNAPSIPRSTKTQTRLSTAISSTFCPKQAVGIRLWQSDQLTQSGFPATGKTTTYPGIAPSSTSSICARSINCCAYLR